MKEKLIIKNFGPIKSVELELGRFNVLIGGNGTGKSVVAKVLAICRYFSFIRDAQGILDTPFEDGLEEWGLSEFIQEKTCISYECNEYSFIANHSFLVENDPQTSEVSRIHHFVTSVKPISEDFKNLLLEFEKIKPKKAGNSITSLQGFNFTIPTSFFQNDVAAVMDNPFYAPTERGLQSIFSLGKNSIRNLSNSLFNHLAELDGIARLFKDETNIEPLDISYKNINGHGYVRKNTDDRYYSLYNAASGYQSTIPIVLLAKYYSEITKKTKTFIIEEPELNLFPSAQNKLMQYLADRTMNYGNSLLLTTHSPYILTSLNNLMYASTSSKRYREEADKIIAKRYWINPDDISVYMMLTNGECENIFDREEGLIKAEKIDTVSRILNEQFDALINLEYSENEFDTLEVR